MNAQTKNAQQAQIEIALTVHNATRTVSFTGRLLLRDALRKYNLPSNILKTGLVANIFEAPRPAAGGESSFMVAPAVVVAAMCGREGATPIVEFELVAGQGGTLDMIHALMRKRLSVASIEISSKETLHLVAVRAFDERYQDLVPLFIGYLTTTMAILEDECRRFWRKQVPLILARLAHEPTSHIAAACDRK